MFLWNYTKKRQPPRQVSDFLIILSEIILISRDTLGYDFLSLLCIGKLINHSLLMLKVLVNLKEVRNFLKNVLWKLCDILVAVVGWVIYRYSDDFLIKLLIVNHFKNADRTALHQGH